MNRISGIIFDMDGVLIDAREWHYRALNMALELFGFTISPELHRTEYDGLPTNEKLNRLSASVGLPVGLHTFINDMKQRYTLQMVTNFCRPVLAHQRALAELKCRGYRLAVASNSIRSSVDTMLSHAGLLPYLDITLSNEDVMCAKPSPEIYTRAITALGLTPQECLVIEDNDYGVAAATAAGATVMRVSGPEEVTLARITNTISALGEAV